MDKQQKKKLWKEKKAEIWNNSKPVLLRRDLDNLHWESRRVDCYFSATINGIKLVLTRHEGTRESYGEKTLLARHFLAKEKWQNQVKDSFGDDALKEIRSSLKKQYDEYKDNQ